VILGSTTVTWYVARAGGLVAFGLLTLVVVVGLALSRRARLSAWPRFAVEDVHRFLGLLTGFFLGVHGLALLLDTYLPFSLSNLVVPGTAAYRPLATALGVVGAELLFALAITNGLRKRLPHRLWRRVHYLSFAVWALALVHGIAAGTDTRTIWGMAFYTAAAGSVTALTVWRALRSRGLEPWALRVWPGAAGAVAVELILTLSLGPLGHRG
jgi:DMSO/TMAO reductase YedYZ heme-binding membrane subunit